MAHTKKSATDRILWTVFFIIIAFFWIAPWLLSFPDDTHDSDALRIENALRNYNSAALMYYTDNDEWPSVGEYLPDSPMVVSLDYYADRSFDKEKYTHLLVKEIPAGSKRLFLGFRPVDRSPLIFSPQARRSLAERSTSFRADGLPYSSDIVGSGDIFVPMRY